MTSNQYNATLTVFFVSYSVFEPLTNVLLKRLRPSIFIPSIMICWVYCESVPLCTVRILINWRLGHLYDLHGPRAQLRGSNGCALVPRLK